MEKWGKQRLGGTWERDPGVNGGAVLRSCMGATSHSRGGVTVLLVNEVESNHGISAVGK